MKTFIFLIFVASFLSQSWAGSIIESKKDVYIDMIVFAGEPLEGNKNCSLKRLNSSQSREFFMEINEKLAGGAYGDSC